MKQSVFLLLTAAVSAKHVISDSKFLSLHDDTGNFPEDRNW